MNHVWIWHILYLVIAAHFFLYDRKKGTLLRRAYIGFHNLTHGEADQCDGDVDRGLVYNQTTKTKLGLSTVMSILFSVIFYLIGSEIPLPVEGLLVFTKSGVVFLGFLLGPLLGKGYGYFHSLVNKVDAIETGALDVKAQLGDIPARMSEGVQGLKERVKGKPEQPEAKEPETAGPEEKPDSYYVARLRNYTEE